MSLKTSIEVIDPKDFPEMLLELVKVNATNQSTVDNYCGKTFDVRVKFPNDVGLTSKNEKLMYVKIYGNANAVASRSRVFITSPEHVDADIASAGNNSVPTGFLLFNIPAGANVVYGAMVEVVEDGYVYNPA
jgi:hypothetical protein